MSEYLQSVLNAFHDMLFVFTEEGIFEDYLTPNHADKLLLPREEFVGRHHRDVLPSHVSRKIEQAIGEVDKGKDRFKFDYHLQVNGEQRWYVAVVSKIVIGDKTGYLSAVRDITRRKTRELLLQGVLNTSPAGIILFRTVRNAEKEIDDFEITHLNRRVEILAGVSEQQLTGKKLSSLVPGKVHDKLMDRFKTAMKTGDLVDFDYRFERETGEKRWYLCRVSKYEDGVVASFLDISERKKTERDLLHKNEELQELNRQKDKLLSVIAHDLKNAISGPLGVLEILVDEIEELSKDELHDYLKILFRGTSTADELLHDLLLWSRNQFQEVAADPKSVDLHEMAKFAFANVEINAAEKEIELVNRIPEQVSVHADPQMVKTILRNLLTNAIKFSHPGSEIVVGAETGEDEVEIFVSDEGIGMDSDTLAKVFDKKTTHTTQGTRGEKGSGLGLDLCIDFVEKHGGRIRAESNPDEGSTFYFTLPRSSKQK